MIKNTIKHYITHFKIRSPSTGQNREKIILYNILL